MAPKTPNLCFFFRELLLKGKTQRYGKAKRRYFERHRVPLMTHWNILAQTLKGLGQSFMWPWGRVIIRSGCDRRKTIYMLVNASRRVERNVTTCTSLALLYKKQQAKNTFGIVSWMILSKGHWFKFHLDRHKLPGYDDHGVWEGSLTKLQPRRCKAALKAADAANVSFIITLSPPELSWPRVSSFLRMRRIKQPSCTPSGLALIPVRWFSTTLESCV